MMGATASSHRQAAFAAAEFLMDYLKTRAPFWKQVEKAGGKMVMPKTDIGPPGFIAIMVDTEGNSVGLHSARA